MEKKNLENLLVDFYEITMGQGYFNKRKDKQIAYFDYFFRTTPDKAGFAISAGVDPLIEYLENFSYTDEDIEFLKTLGMFTEDYLEELKNIKFTGDVWAVKDGTPVFPNEPIITIRAPLLQAQLIETKLLVLENHANLITTKTNRIVRSAGGRSVMEFGSRRAQGDTAAIRGAYYAYLGGAVGTACTETGKIFGVPLLGTMAHSFVQSFDNEYEAFKAYAETFPDNTILLVDTYDVLKQGIPNAIKIDNEVLKPIGKRLKGIRIDSGDLVDLTKKARVMLDDAGLQDAKIVVSNSLDEYKIEDYLERGAKIDMFGVGENMITAKSTPVFGGVYKLVAVEENNEIVPKIKLSEDIEKTTNPDLKNIFRVYDKNGMIVTDLLARHDEKIDTEYTIENLREKVMENGKRIVPKMTAQEIRKNIQDQIKKLNPEALKLNNAKVYKIQLTKALKALKDKLIDKNSI